MSKKRHQGTPTPTRARAAALFPEAGEPVEPPRAHAVEAGEPAEPPRAHAIKAGEPVEPPGAHAIKASEPVEPTRAHAVEAGEPAEPPRAHAVEAGEPVEPPGAHAIKAGEPVEPPRAHAVEAGEPVEPPRAHAVEPGELVEPPRAHAAEAADPANPTQRNTMQQNAPNPEHSSFGAPQNATLPGNPDPAAPPHSVADEPPEPDAQHPHNDTMQHSNPRNSQPEVIPAGAAIPDIDPWLPFPQPSIDSRLTQKQRHALPYIAAAPSLAQAARAAGIDRSSIYRWLQDDSFRSEVARVREATADVARGEVQAAMLHSLAVILDCTNSQNDIIRLRASRYLINLGLKINDLRDLGAQIKDLHESVRDARD